MNATNKLSPILKSGIRPILTEFGKIKIGGKEKQIRIGQGGNKWQAPERYDHFVVTTLERGEDGNFIRDESIHSAIGDKPARLKIRLLYNDPAMNFQCRFVRYDGKKVACMGDGELAFLADGAEIACPCEKSEPSYNGKDVCKMNGVLSCILEQTAKLGGVYKFRTTSFNAIQGILSALQFISQQTHGILAGIPLELVLIKKAAANPKTGEPVQIFFVTIEYSGNIQNLLESATEVRQAALAYDNKIKLLTGETIEEELSAELAEPGEFYPPAPDEIETRGYNPETGEIVENALDTSTGSVTGSTGSVGSASSPTGSTSGQATEPKKRTKKQAEPEIINPEPEPETTSQTNQIPDDVF